MVTWRRSLLLAVCLAAGLLAGRPAAAQSTGQAVITAPLPGATVAGVVAILGSATHPQFERYELAFSYDPDPTGTWFSIQEPVKVPMPAGLLGRWDTAGIADGLYVLRLRVYTSEREYVETLVRGVAVQNSASPLPPATPITPALAPEVTPTASPIENLPTATVPLIALPPAPTARPTAARPAAEDAGSFAGLRLSAAAAQRAFGAGVQITFILFGLAGLYLGAKFVVLTVWRRRRRP